MNKFKKVDEALSKKTKNSGNWLALKRGRAFCNINSKCKYHTFNVVTNQAREHYKSLCDVIKEFNLKI